MGAIYALVALGFTLIYNASDVLNFAQGEFVMLGGMVTVFAAAAGVPLPLAALLAIAVAVAVGLGLYYLAIAPARGASAVSLIIITIGASILMRGIASIVFDKNFHSLAPFAGNKPIIVGGAALLPQSIIVLFGAGLIVLVLWLFITHTLTGKAILATAANRLAARLVGINTGAVVALSFAVSAAVGAFGGVLAAPITLTSYDAGTLLALKGIAAGQMGFGAGGSVTLADIPGGPAKGTYGWSGAAGTNAFVDPVSGIRGVLMINVLGDETLRREVTAAIYADLRR